IPLEVRELFEDERCFIATFPSDPDSATNPVPRPLPANSPHATNVLRPRANGFRLPLTNQNFWHLVAALRDFVQNEGGGQLPVRGTLPDMTSDSTRYLRLLSIYRDQSDWAVERIASRVKQYPEITLNDVRLFGEFEELFVVFLASYISPCIFQFTLDDLVSWKQCWALWKNRNI
ncbi:Amyloid beta protein binding protein 1, partial [Fasciolopsis buskii]